MVDQLTQKKPSGDRRNNAPSGKSQNFKVTKKEAWWEKLGADNLPTFQRNFYKVNVEVEAMSEEQVDVVRKDLKITIKDPSVFTFRSKKQAKVPDAETTEANLVKMKVPRPVTTFAQSGLPRYLVEQLQANFAEPTPIQSQAWPTLLSGRDMMGIAATGSGKTLAYILPSIVHVNAQDLLDSGDGPVVLVLLPTRELAIQVEKECSRFASTVQISSAACFGGMPRHEQSAKLEKGVEILIATPGRLIDFIDTNVTNMRRVTYLVLDEADRMLDMGFEAQIQKILRQIRPDRQTLMFSATWPKEVEQLARSYCSNYQPVHVQIGDLKLQANINIKQEVLVVDVEQKYAQFFDLMCSLNGPQSQAKDSPKVIVFCQTKRGVDELVKNLRNEGHSTVKAIHGDKSQQERESILKEFAEGRTCSVLIATDVASRGLDIKDIQYVINYDIPYQIEDYVHRVGRTARAGCSGTAYSFVTKKDFMVAPQLVEVLQQQADPADIARIPEKLKQLALLGLKAQATDMQTLRRRWRKIGGEDEKELGPTDRMRKKAVKVSDLIKMREQEKEEKKEESLLRTADQGTAVVVEQAENESVVQALKEEAVPTATSAAPVDVTPSADIVKFQQNYFEPVKDSESAKEEAGEKGIEAVQQQSETLPGTDAGMTGAETKPEAALGDTKPEQKETEPECVAPVNPVYKKKWGAKK